MNKDIKDIIKGALSSVLGWVIIGIIGFVPVLLTFFGFDWIKIGKNIWYYKVSIVYLIALFLLFIILYFFRIGAFKRKRENEFREVEKFRYNDVDWEIGVYNSAPINKKTVKRKFPKNKYFIKREPICPDCGTELEDYKSEWQCLSESCTFRKRHGGSFISVSEKALKAWKSQNTAKSP